ncbi:hypothetical protein OG804_01390 [Nocardia sp. NBC_00416]
MTRTAPCTRCDELVVLPGVGPAAYLDIDAILAAAAESGATAIHPGYGFLSENADFARACRKAEIVFVGPAPETLELFGDKGRARRLAQEQEVPVLPGTTGPTSEREMAEFLAAQSAPVTRKAVAGGRRPRHQGGPVGCGITGGVRAVPDRGGGRLRDRGSVRRAAAHRRAASGGPTGR